jgi:release factor glutamine methyltransferase
LTIGATTIGAAWRAVRDRFVAQGITTGALDARLLAQEAFGLDGLALRLNENLPANQQALDHLHQMEAQRLAGTPVARLLGHKEFYGLDFALNAATLVPRPETELLVDLGLEALKGLDRPKVADFGTGSGCIVISILHQHSSAQGVGVDLSADALGMAAQNAKTHDVAGRLSLREGAWFAPIADGELFDVIVSNPPYIPAADILELATEVREHDPILALDGGVDGLDPYAEIAQGALVHLRAGGFFAVECGVGQADALAGLLVETGFEAVRTHQDLAGIARVVHGRRAKD